MRKPFNFTELSDVKCQCGKKLKKNVVARKTEPSILGILILASNMYLKKQRKIKSLLSLRLFIATIV